MKKKIMALAFAAMLLISQVTSFAKVEVKTVNLRGKSVNVTTIDLDEKTEIKVAKPNGKQVGTAAFTDFVNSYKPKAAINANYFEAYNGGKFPYGTQMTGGVMINMEGANANLIVFDKNKAKIVHGTFKYKGYMDGKRKNEWNNGTQSMDFNLFDVWYVNVKPTDTSGVYIFNSFRNAPTTVTGGYAIEVVNNTVKKVYKANGDLTVPKDGYLIYYGSDFSNNTYVTDRFKEGRTVELELVLSHVVDGNTVEDKTFDYKGEKVPFAKLSEIISASPMLIENSKLVYEKHVAGMEAKMTKGAGARSLIGINKNGQLVLATTSGTMGQVAGIMQDLGCTDAFNLDGGASSAMYANGKYIRKAGRALNTVLVIRDQVKPAK